MADIKIPPHSEEAERSVLGCVLIDRNALVDVVDKLTPEMFYQQSHSLIFECAMELYTDRNPVDVVTVADKLKEKKALKKIGGNGYLAELAANVPTSAHAEKYAEIVRGYSIKRQMITLAAELNEMALEDGGSIEGLLDRAEKNVFALSQKNIKRDFVAIRDALSESFDRLDELQRMGGGLRGMPTGFADLDGALAGMQESNLLILAARPGMGKTTLALNIAQYMAVEKKIPVGMFSLEMSYLELLDRLLVTQSNVDAWKMKTGNLSDSDFGSLSEAMGVLADSPVFIDDSPGQSILEMRTKARRLQAEHGVKMIIVDYLQLAVGAGKFDSRASEVQSISQGLKNLARELKIPVLALSQLNRSIESRGDKVPQLSDLRESGCITGESLVTRADTGERVRIVDLLGQSNISILAMDKDYKLVPAKISKVFSSGRKRVYELTLKSGRTIKASSNHPFYKLSGWTRLDKLAVGDRLAVPRVLNLKKSVSAISDARLILLAHLIGDGCYLKRQPLHYTNSDQELIEVVRKAAVDEFEVAPRVVAQQTWYNLYLPGKKKLARGIRNPIVKWLDEELNIFNQRSREKMIPDVIFGLSEGKQALFLGHLWVTDGCVWVSEDKKKMKVGLYYASGNRRLVEQVSHLLLRLGIVSKISSSCKKGYQDMWTVAVQGKISQERFLKSIPLVGKKGKLAQMALEALASVKANPNNDVIPAEIWQEIERLRKVKGWSTREFHKRMGWAYSGTQRHKNGVSRLRLAKICKVLNDEKMTKLANSDLFWDEVVSVKKIGVKEVYDATVPGLANFVANDIIIHNSIEQDADVVMFLFRSEDDNLEDYRLNIAKHRNGPLKTIEFKFKGNKMRFFGIDKKN